MLQVKNNKGLLMRHRFEKGWGQLPEAPPSNGPSMDLIRIGLVHDPSHSSTT